MNVLVLMGSPRKTSNTDALCKPFVQELNDNGCDVRYVTLSDKDIHPCLGCYTCQNIEGSYGCIQHDYMYNIVEDIMWADTIVLATPIYAWYCTACMKAVLDRHYGLNKYYGSASGSLWSGKKVALITTHGYEGDYATKPFETGIIRLCEHSDLKYIGMYSVEDEDDLNSFVCDSAVNGAKDFAKKILSD